MGDGLDRDLLHEGQDALDIDAGGGQQRLAQGLAAQGLHGGLQIRVLHVQNLADQGEAVGVHPGGGQAEDHVAGLDLGLVKDLVLIHHAHGEAGQVILVDGIEAGHLGGLAADEGSAGLDTALGHTGDDARDLLRDVLAAGDVVQEEQGLGTHADDVVDAHGHAVDAHGVVLVHEERQLEFRAHAVGAGDQDGLGDAGQVQLEQAAKAADVGQGSGGHGLGDVGLHEFYGLVPGGDVHPGGGVAVRSRSCIHCAHSFPFQQ